MTLDEIRELIQLVTETGVAELEVQRGEDRVRIRRAFGAAQDVVLAPQSLPPASANAASPQPAVHPQSGADSAQGAGPDPSLVLVKSPIVGTFYEAPSPDTPPFVRVGERVQPGKVLCIIESMKLMNEIEAETSGIIESKLVQNGQPVEFGQPLFKVDGRK